MVKHPLDDYFQTHNITDPIAIAHLKNAYAIALQHASAQFKHWIEKQKREAYKISLPI